jgi:DNA-binding beta-propeller fold protein YncE
MRGLSRDIIAPMNSNGAAVRKIIGCFCSLALSTSLAILADAQQSNTAASKNNSTAMATAVQRDAPLVFTEAISLENAKGRFDHFAMGEGKLFVAALGSNVVEVINIGGRILDHAITGVPDPQGIAFSPETNKLFVASGRGKVYIYDGKSYDQIATVDFPGGADNLRYDAATKRVYVGCGDDEKTGAIAMIDATTNQRLDEEYKLGGEPESLQLEKSGPNIYVNVPDPKEIVVINRATKQSTHWPLKGVESNFPMALDEADHRLFVGVHVPPRLAVIDTTTGRLIAVLPSVQDSDDLYFDADRKRIYMPGGQGFIYVFQMTDPNHYRLLDKIPTAIGAKTAGYYGKQGKGFDRFYLAVPSRGGQSAEIRIYTVQD